MLQGYHVLIRALSWNVSKWLLLYLCSEPLLLNTIIVTYNHLSQHSGNKMWWHTGTSWRAKSGSNSRERAESYSMCFDKDTSSLWSCLGSKHSQKSKCINQSLSSKYYSIRVGSQTVCFFDVSCYARQLSGCVPGLAHSYVICLGITWCYTCDRGLMGKPGKWLV